ncbi:MAG: MarR family transcriptional regulator [Solirubrobacterales bacterium]|nr:MarR family transcriptional regulator [Solirubrobacterales bacterium]MBV8940112.1 MarR family transcriptional regulator [Solirubrobacterales bacterium]MBV9536121.1 MarR family transcriptional regulator [Solirubrobacterales bacterium]
MSVITSSRTDALEELARAFKAATAALRRLRGRETHRPGELSYAQYGLLFGLCDGTPRSLRELASAADVSPATAAEMLESLAASGLVARIRSAEDKRVVLTSLTDRGRALIDERRARYEPRWRAALQDFSEEELLTAAGVLERVRAIFDEVAEES